MQTQRSSFGRQPARILLIDISQPFDLTACGILKESLSHFFSLTCSISGPCRLPFFGLFALGTYPEAVFPLQNLSGNYGRLQNALTELESIVNTVRGNTGPHGSITQGIREAATMFRRQSQNLLQTAGYWAQLELTILTCQSPSTVIRQVEKATQDIALDTLKKVQVVHVNNLERVGSVHVDDVAGSESSCSQRSQTSDTGLVDWISLDEDIFSLENFFKGWLQDCSTDTEHLHLTLPSNDESDLVLKCDLRERLLSPHQLPLADKFLVRCDSPVSSKPGSNTSISKGSGHTATLYKLKVIRKIAVQSVCESVLFDMPMIVRSTTCWKMDWDDLETNQQHFIALCHLLKDKDQALLAVLEGEVAPVPTRRSSSFRYQVAPPIICPHFLLLPSHTGTLLLKPLAVSELSMPCDVGGGAGDKPNETSLDMVGQYLDKVEEGEGYNPLVVSSNLYQCLESRLMKSTSGGSFAGTKRKGSTVTYPSSFQPASSALGIAKPLGSVKGSSVCRSSSTTTPPPRPPPGSRSRKLLVPLVLSGREFYGKPSDFPTEL